MAKQIYTRIAGTGSHLPTKIIGNQDFVNNRFYDAATKAPFDKSNEEIIQKFQEITNIDELEKDLLSRGRHFAELSSGKTNQTELVGLLINEGKDVILEIEVQGALQIRKIFPQALLLFVTPPSGNILKERLEGRGTEEPEVVAQRLAIASRESLLMEQYDYIIVNDDLDKAVSYVHELIQSEHGRTMRNTQLIDRIQNELAVFAKGEVK